MSNVIDQRVVSMEFDCEQFERGVARVLISLDNLTAALDKTNSYDAFKNIGKSMSNIDTAALEKKVDHLSNFMEKRFSAIGETIHKKIQGAIEGGLDAVTGTIKKYGGIIAGLDTVGDGFKKFTEKTSNVATLMTATGKGIDDVSKALDELQWFTDETSYDFTTMSNVMGRFAAGMPHAELNDLVRISEGIALWAAESGQSATTASHAMMQLAQAYGKGKIQLQDWMSIEMANMSTSKIQNELIREGGDAAQVAIAKYGGFRDSLRAGWLTVDTFNKVMYKYTQGINSANYETGVGFKKTVDEAADGVSGFAEKAFYAAQEARTFSDVIKAVQDSTSSGWAHIYEAIFGNYEEAKALWSGLCDAMLTWSEAFLGTRVQMAEEWKALGGREALIKSFINLANALLSRIVPIKQAFRDIFPSKTGKDLADMTKNFSNFTEKLVLSRERMGKLYLTAKKVFTAIKSFLDVIKGAISTVVTAINKAKLTDVTTAIRKGFGNAAEAVGGLFEKFKDGDKEIGKSKGLSTLLSILERVGTAIKTVGSILAGGVIVSVGLLVKGFQALVEAAKGIPGHLTNAFSSVSKWFTEIESKSKNLPELITNIFKSLGGNISTGLSTALPNVSAAIDNLFKTLRNSSAISGSINKVTKVLKDFFNIIKTFGLDVLDFLIEKFNDLTNYKFNIPGVDELTKKVEEIKQRILDFFASIGVVRDSFLDLFNPIKALNDIFGDFSGATKEVNDGVLQLTEAFDSITPSADVVNRAVATTEDNLQSASEIFKQIGTAIEEHLKTIAKSEGVFGTLARGLLVVVQVAKTIDWRKVLAFGILALYVKGLWSFAAAIRTAGVKVEQAGNKFIDTFGGVAGALKNMFNAVATVKNVTSAITGYITALKKGLNYNAFLKISMGIGLLAAAFAGLAVATHFLDNWDLITAGIALAAFSVVLTGVTAAFVHFSETVNPIGIAAIGGVLISLSIAIAMLTGSLKSLGKFFEASTKIFESVAALVAMAVAMSTVATILSYASPKLRNAGLGLISFAIGLGAFMGIITPLIGQFGILDKISAVLTRFVNYFNAAIDELVSGTGIFKAEKILVAFVGFIVGFVAIDELLHEFGKIAKDFGKTMMAFSASMVLLAAALGLMKAVIKDSTLVVDFITVLGSLVVASLIMAQLNKNLSGEVKNFNKNLLAFSAGMLLLTDALVMMQLVKFDSLGDWAQTMATLAVLFTGLAGAIKLMGEANPSGVAGAMLGMVASLYLLIPPMILLGALPLDLVAQGMLTICGYIMAMGKAFQWMSNVNIGTLVADIIAFNTSIWSLYFVLLKMQEFDVATILASAGAIGGIALAFAGATKIMGGDWSAMAAAATGMMLIAVAVIPFADGLSRLSNISAGQILAVAGGLAAMTVALGLLGPKMTAGAIGMIAFGAAAVELGVAIAAAAAGIGVAAAGIALIPAAVGLAAAAIALLCKSFGALLGVIKEFIQSMPKALKAFESLDPRALSKVANSITQIGAALTTLAIGAGAVGAALLLLNPTLNKFADTVLKITKVVPAVVTAITTLKNAFSGIGQNITAGLNNGMEAGMSLMPKLGGKMVSLLVNTVESGFGIASPSKVFKWIAEMIWKGFNNGTEGGFSVAKLAAKAFTGDYTKIVSNGLSNMGKSATGPMTNLLGTLTNGMSLLPGIGKEGTGSFLTTISEGFSKLGGIGSGGISSLLTSLSGKGGAFASVGKLLGDMLGGNANNSLIGWLGTMVGNTDKALDMIKQRLSSLKVRINTKKDDKNYQLGGGEALDEKLYLKNLEKQEKLVEKEVGTDTMDSMFDSLLNFDDFNVDTSSLGDLSNAFDTSAISAGNFADATDKAGKSSKEAAKSAEELAKKQQMLSKYMDYSNRIVKVYTDAFEAAGGSTEDVATVSETAKKAVDQLAESIYKDSLKASDSIEDTSKTAEERAEAVKEAFVKAYEDIKNNVESSIDLFTKFSYSMNDLSKPDTVLKNAKSQIDAMAELGAKYIALANKGFSPEVIANIESQGVSAMGKINDFLLFSIDQVASYNEAYANQAVVAAGVATEALTARSIALQRQQLEAAAAMGDELAKAALEQMQSVNSQIDVLMEYQVKYESMQSTIQELIESQMNLFEKLELKTDTTSAQMLENMRSQVEGITKWAAECQILAKRGIDEGLLAALEQLGPDGYEKLHAFVTMSDAQLAEANQLYQTSLTLPQSASHKIAQSYALAGNQSMADYIKAVEAQRGPAKQTMDNTGVDMYQGLENGLAKEKPNVMSQLATDAQDAVDKYNSGVGVASPSWKFEETGVNMYEGLMIGMRKGNDYALRTAENSATDLVRTFSDIMDFRAGDDIGRNIMAGMRSGIEGERWSVMAAAEAIANSVVWTIQSALKIHSPSRVLTDIGKFIDYGLANGIEKNTDSVSSATHGLVDTFMAAMSGLTEEDLNLDTEFHPVITPVLDLSDVQNGARSISGLMGGGFRIGAGVGSLNFAKPANNVTPTSGDSYTYGNTEINIYAQPNQNVRELADEVALRLNVQMQRRKAAMMG